MTANRRPPGGWYTVVGAMDTTIHEDGSVTAPRRAEADGVVGDALHTYPPGSDEARAWIAWARQNPEAVHDERA